MTKQQKPASYVPETSTVGRRRVVGSLETALQDWGKRSGTIQWCPDTFQLECTIMYVYTSCTLQSNNWWPSNMFNEKAPAGIIRVKKAPVRTAGITSIWDQTSKKPTAEPCWEIWLHPSWSISFPLISSPAGALPAMEVHRQAQDPRGEKGKTLRKRTKTSKLMF